MNVELIAVLICTLVLDEPIEMVVINWQYICSDAEASSGHHDKKKKDRQRGKRKVKGHDHRMPRLTIIGIEQNGEVVECQLETAKHSAVTFKFNREDDEPSVIADNLVSSHSDTVFV